METKIVETILYHLELARKKKDNDVEVAYELVALLHDITKIVEHEIPKYLISKLYNIIDEYKKVKQLKECIKELLDEK